MKRGMTILPLLALSVLLLQGCGQNETQQGDAGSFSDAAVQEVVQTSPKPAGLDKDKDSDGAQQPVIQERKDEENQAAVAAESKAQSDGAKKSGVQAKEGEGEGDSTSQSIAPPQSSKPAPQSAKDGDKAKNETKPLAPVSPKAGAAADRKADARSSKTGESKKVAKGTDNTNGSVVESQSSAQKKSGVSEIGWGDFFDGDDQTTPSERFWDLSGSTVKIQGFMGEVLSFDNHWFLLIPQPGAECPFDNGDETYWNKIMIVFVPDDVKLRYKSEALEITGRLDVGIKIDESGYKTMFRLYDASFKEIKE